MLQQNAMWHLLGALLIFHTLDFLKIKIFFLFINKNVYSLKNQNKMVNASTPAGYVDYQPLDLQFEAQELITTNGIIPSQTDFLEFCTKEGVKIGGEQMYSNIKLSDKSQGVSINPWDLITLCYRRRK